MKTIRPLILLAALFSFTASGAYAQANGPENGEQNQKRLRQGPGEKCDNDQCDNDKPNTRLSLTSVRIAGRRASP